MSALSPQQAHVLALVIKANDARKATLPQREASAIGGLSDDERREYNGFLVRRRYMRTVIALFNRGLVEPATKKSGFYVVLPTEAGYEAAKKAGPQ